MNDSVLNKIVSCFSDYKEVTNPKNVNLITWLTSNKYEKEVLEIRRLKDKRERDQIKSTLPAITPSGMFKQRKQSGLVSRSGLIQFDIDLKENKHIINYKQLKEQICNISNVAYCGLSVSGTGYWGLIPVEQPEQHKKHFLAIEQDFKRLGITIDSAPKNISSLRGYSFDSEGYFNHQAELYKKLYERLVKTPTINFTANYTDGNETKNKVEILVNKISQQSIDITDNYDDWFIIGVGFAKEFGETGRTYFHTVSQFHCEYDYTETDDLYTRILRRSYSDVNISSFFYYCKVYDITFNEQAKRTGRNSII